MIGIAVGPPSPTKRIPQWRRDRGATVPECVHAVAGDWPGPACNFGHDPAVKRITGWFIRAGRVTCGACRHLAASSTVEHGPPGGADAEA